MNPASDMEHLFPSVCWLYPVKEEMNSIQLVEDWTHAQLSFSVAAFSWKAFDCKPSTPIVGGMLSLPTTFKRWMKLPSNHGLLLKYTAAVTECSVNLTHSVVSGNLHVCVGSCVMVASCAIMVDKPLHFENMQVPSGDVDPIVNVSLSNFRAAGPVVHNNASRCNKHAVKMGIGTPRFALKEDFPNAEAGKQLPTEHKQRKISL